MNYTFIKRFLLLSSLSVCWQISPLAIDAMEVEKLQGGHKRSATQAGLYPAPSPSIDCSFMGFPRETKIHLVNCFDIKRDQNTLLCLMTSCTAFRYLVMDKYQEANEAEHHYLWQDGPSLCPSTVYILNSRMRTILGLYANIRAYPNMAYNIDRLKFQRRCTQFLKKSLLHEASVPNMYVGLLELDLSYAFPTSFQAPFRADFEGKLRTIKQSCIIKLSGMVDPQNSNLQNEHALYFHYCHFVSGMQPVQLAQLKNTDLFSSLNSSLMGGMNTDLLTAKKTPNLDSTRNFAQTWKRIIELEPAVTIQQLCSAGDAYVDAGFIEADPAAKAANLTKAAEYYEEVIREIKASGGKIPEEVYDDIVNAYFQIAADYLQVGETAADPAAKAASFTKAAEYYEKTLKTMIAGGTNASAIFYNIIADAYFLVGKTAADPATKAASFTKAAEYFNISLSSKVLADYMAEKTRKTLEEISPYLDHSDNGANDLNVEAQVATGFGG